jgi:glycosyltransferase involved in cell wall biosynthesis
MKIRSICLVKDEADIVKDVITDARQWSDYNYIYDNGSTDGTTEILIRRGKNILTHSHLSSTL